MSKYPRYSGISREKKNKKCFICGESTQWVATIEVNKMRGDDDVVACCNTHPYTEINQHIISKKERMWR